MNAPKALFDFVPQRPTPRHAASHRSAPLRRASHRNAIHQPQRIPVFARPKGFRLKTSRKAGNQPAHRCATLRDAPPRDASQLTSPMKGHFHAYL